jgi:hypothetical protein
VLDLETHEGSGRQTSDRTRARTVVEAEREALVDNLPLRVEATGYVAEVIADRRR